MKLSKKLSLTLIVSLLVLLSACSKKPVMDAVPAPVVSEAPAAPAPVAPVVEAASATLTTTTGSQLEAVYFDFDSHVLSSAARQALERNAALLSQAPELAVTIEGHCDERGADTYNLALGEQRALAVKSHLVALNISAERLKTISYGEERPATIGSDEAVWSKNRRAAFN